MSSNEEDGDELQTAMIKSENTANIGYSQKEIKEYINILGPSFGWIGVAIAWCLQGGYGTPYLLELGLQETNVNYVFLAGPVTGMIAQPLVGSYSDKIQSRKPFIIVGAITMFIMLIIFSNARFISNKYALVIAISSFWINDFFISVLMAPLRALVSDTISSAKQIDAMSWFSIFGSLGALVAFGFGSLISNVSILFLIGAVFILVTVTITLKIVKAPTFADNQQMDDHKDLCWNGFINIFIGIKNAPPFLWKLMLSQFFIFAAFLPFWIYGTHFYGENLMKGYVNETNIGSKEYKLYQQGVKYGNLSFFITSVVNIMVSYLIAKYFMNRENKKRIKTFWMFSYILYGIFGCVTPWVDNIILFMFFHAISSFAGASMHIFPWTFASEYAVEYEPQNAGIILSILNISVCVPQIFVAVIGGGIIEYFNGDVSSVLFVGGIFAFVAALSVYFVDITYKGKKVKYNMVEQTNNSIELMQHAIYL